MYYQALVNKKQRYREEMFFDRVLVSTKDIDGEKIEIEEQTYEAYLLLQKFLLEKKGYELGLASAYRSLDTQQEVYDQFVSSYGKEYAKRIVAPVGASEHHTGLCLDFSIKKDGKFTADNHLLMKDVKRYQEVVPYLATFGFILRYPKGKEIITGYPYEPWHIRYIGVDLAEKLYKDNLTLEEYYQNLSGVLVVKKEKEMTSRDVVNMVSKYYYTKKVGHTGTLDPLATGVLVITIGKATRISEMLTATYKEYIATVKLGVETDTLDITGEVLRECEIFNHLDIKEVLHHFQKTYMQEVPLYSAVKVDGKKLYEYARQKENVDLPKKEVTIKEIELLDQQEDTFSFRVVVSKGTYIRSLIRDIGVEAGLPMTMLALERTKQGAFSLEEAYRLEELKTGNAQIISLKEALRGYPQIVVDEMTEQKIRNGQRLSNLENRKGPCIMLNQEGEVLAIYKGEDKKLIAWKVLTGRND